MEQIFLYLKESYNELVNKVTWPSWSSLLASTRLVLVATVIISLFVLVMDVISKQVLTFIYNL